MKSFLLSVGLLIFAGQFALAQNDFRIGGKLMYGSEIERFGIGATGEIPIIEKLVIAPDIGFYFPRNEHGIKTNAFELNGNVNYYFIEQENLGFYGLGGLNYTRVKVSSDVQLGDDNYRLSGSDGKVGLNLGAGANFHIGQGFIPFAEVKYVIIDDFDQLVIAAGVKFNL